MATITSGATPYWRSARDSASALACQNAVPSAISLSLTVDARNWYQGREVDGLSRMRMMLGFSSTLANTASSSGRLNWPLATCSSM
ncbi:Uncharacterised protein [Chromobacterium violaceum]|uniref:Uncharacterized protein n=1 Tax=Chromobacterium violaceum TaxID=536 RepID=A0A3S4LGM5_CHRVL|nr:Uncharacterised protein [Chromobacterium violaceum]